MTDAGTFWGYSLAPEQAEFYVLILIALGGSLILVALVYLYMWLADAIKKSRVPDKNFYLR